MRHPDMAGAHLTVTGPYLDRGDDGADTLVVVEVTNYVRAIPPTWNDPGADAEFEFGFIRASIDSGGDPVDPLTPEEAAWLRAWAEDDAQYGTLYEAAMEYLASH